MFSCRQLSVIAIALTLVSPAAFAAVANDAALILPLKGRLAKASTVIRDGFLAAYYNDLSANKATPIVRIYDNGEGHGVTLVNQAAFDGADIIVGPLNKEQVAQLSAAGSPPVPVIALNRTEHNVTQLYQFALAPEDEIKAVVRSLQAQGIKKVRVFMQKDASSQRNREAFETEWAQTGGQLDTAFIWSPGNKGGVTAAIRDMLKAKKDIGAVFLATPGLAKQVRPAMDFYYAKQMPLYTLSSSYDSQESAMLRNDLNNTRFCETPWILGEESALQSTIYDVFGKPSSSFDRLYGFGADAYELMSALYTDRYSANLKGASGHLSLDKEGRIQRDLQCVEIRDGNPQAL